MQAERGTYIRVGVFVVAALVIVITLVFIIGNRTNLFRSKAEYVSVFERVDGLRQGSPVRIAGVTVGAVSSVRFSETGQVRVTFDVVSDASDLVREGSHAAVGSKGMLGDKLLEVTVGEGAKLPPGSTVPTEEAVPLSDYLASAGRIMSDVEAIAENVRRATEPLGEPEFGESLRATTRNMAEVTRLVAEGDGTVRRLLTDGKLADDVAQMVDSLRVTSSELAATSRGVRAIVQEVQSGNGTAHELIYGQEGTRMVSRFADAAGEVATLLAHVRTNKGTMHDLLYEDAANELMGNLTEASENIRAITADVREGKGTLGALVQDPSVYEDVKRLLGDLQRNDILRALVRYSIKRDETPEAAQAAPAK
jgi:phospholipid/cholesterol/gamma-HCH transport system substrate-binding protein